MTNTRWKLSAASQPANYTHDDPLDLAGKQPLFDAMDTQWWNLPPEEGERAVVNAFRATMLSPRMNLKGNAVLYQSLMHIDPHESDPQVFESAIRDLKQRWDAQGQTPIEGQPTDVMAVDEILPGKFQPGIWTNIRRVAALGPYADEIYKAAMLDIAQYGGSGKYFRDRILQLNIPGVKAKVASFAWLALAPNTSELGTIDVHMMRHLDQDEDSPRNTTHYLALEDQLRQERDDTYGSDVPLSKYQWGVWDKRRTPGFHQDHSPLRPVDPVPYTDIHWAPQPRPPRPQRLPEADPNQLQLAKWKISDSQAFHEDAKEMLNEYEALARDIMRTLPEEEWPTWVKNMARYMVWGDPEPVDMTPYPHKDDRPGDLTLPENWSKSKWAFIRISGYALKGNVVATGPQRDVDGIAVRMDQPREQILEMLSRLPGHAQDVQQQRQIIPDYAINRGGKVSDIRTNPDATGYSYGAGAIVVAEWVDVNDNWLLYHDAVVGIVAGKGGATSHGVVVARERNIPIVVDVQDWNTIQAGDQLQMDSRTGIIQVSGGSTEDLGEATEAEEPVIAFVWSQGVGKYLPVPQGSGGSATLHREMLREMKHEGTLNKQNYAIGVVYANGRAQTQGEPTDKDQMIQWLNTIVPVKTLTPTG